MSRPTVKGAVSLMESQINARFRRLQRPSLSFSGAEDVCTLRIGGPIWARGTLLQQQKGVMHHRTGSFPVAETKATEDERGRCGREVKFQSERKGATGYQSPV